ncbi:MAG: carboxypeptidase-like regulatory domain-containing protein [Bacteroidetes bacterium]|nr:MAG: carboxypeptidase-like regulatory domain-containing protein [Bacteroidota bacterium]
MKTSKYILIGILFLVAHGVTFASSPDHKTGNAPNSALKGEITDRFSKEKLAGVTITIEGLNEKLYSDAEGNFTVTGLEPGEYQADFKLISYKEQKMNIKVKLSENHKIRVSLESIEP